MTISANENSQEQRDNEDSTVCYCFRKTTRDLKADHAKYGSLAEMEKHTKVGTACCGCKVVLEAMFGETPVSAYLEQMTPTTGSVCAKPGNKFMKGFIIHNKNIYSQVFASNAVAPQLGDCDTSAKLEYFVLDHTGLVILSGDVSLRTNETFTFDTREHKLPEDFYGMFILHLHRQNYGATRFNIYWNNEHGSTSTHEIGVTGRPRVFIPIIADQGYLSGPNTVYLGMQNPHLEKIKMDLTAFDVDSKEELTWQTELAAHASSWINVNKYFFQPALSKFKDRRVALKIANSNLKQSEAISNYFFIHNMRTNIWTANHL